MQSSAEDNSVQEGARYNLQRVLSELVNSISKKTWKLKATLV